MAFIIFSWLSFASSASNFLHLSNNHLHLKDLLEIRRDIKCFAPASTEQVVFAAAEHSRDSGGDIYEFLLNTSRKGRETREGVKSECSWWWNCGALGETLLLFRSLSRLECHSEDFSVRSGTLWIINSMHNVKCVSECQTSSRRRSVSRIRNKLLITLSWMEMSQQLIVR